MIPRYSRPEMANIFEQDNKFRIWLEVETLALEKMADLGIVPKEAAKDLREKGDFDVDRINEIEAEVKHDVIAFLTSVAEHVGENSRYVHQGMTSSDVIDTSFAVQLTQAADIIIKDLERVCDALEKRAKEHKDTVCIGRSHGIHGEPTTFGMKLAGHYAAFARAKGRMIAAKEEVSTVIISGAAGTYPQGPVKVLIAVQQSVPLPPAPGHCYSHDRYQDKYQPLAGTRLRLREGQPFDIEREAHP